MYINEEFKYRVTERHAKHNGFENVTEGLEQEVDGASG